MELDKIDYWKDIIAKLNESGLTMRAFAKERNLKEHQIEYWKRKFDEEENKDKENDLLIEILIKTTPNDNTQTVSNKIEIKIKDISINIKGNINEIIKSIFKV